MNRFPILVMIFAGLFFQSLVAQQTLSKSISHDGIQRDYSIYIPATYSSSSAVPLLLNFHGYGSNGDQQMIYGDFRSIADTANFILVHPEGTVDNSGSTWWNADWGGAVDDIGFVSDLIDSISAEYTIDSFRVYATGMSNGGFMSFTLACNLWEKVAAIASVTGAMTTNQMTGISPCSPERPVPVMSIHGTADATVPYVGGGWMASIPSIMDFWANKNNCDLPAEVSSVPDINFLDGSTVEKSMYKNCDFGVEMEHYKVIDGGHAWPGSILPLPGTNYDINSSAIIWEFFSQFDLGGKINTVSDNQSLNSAAFFNLFPNPTDNIIQIEFYAPFSGSIHLQNPNGKTVRNESVTNISQFQLNLEKLPKGIYLLSGTGSDRKWFSQKIIRN